MSIWQSIRDQKVEVVEKKYELQPFKDWDENQPGQSLLWWQVYNLITHSRGENKPLANQLNAVTILAALYMLEMKQLNVICDGKEPDLPEEASVLFELDNWNYRFLPSSEGYAYVDGYYCTVDSRRIHWKHLEKR